MAPDIVPLIFRAPSHPQAIGADGALDPKWAASRDNGKDKGADVSDDSPAPRQGRVPAVVVSARLPSRLIAPHAPAPARALQAEAKQGGWPQPLELVGQGACPGSTRHS